VFLFRHLSSLSRLIMELEKSMFVIVKPSTGSSSQRIEKLTVVRRDAVVDG